MGAMFSRWDQNVLKVLGVVCHSPPEQSGISFPPGILLQRFLYPIGRSLVIIFSGLQGSHRWRTLSRGDHWDIVILAGRLRRRTSIEGGIWMDDW